MNEKMAIKLREKHAFFGDLCFECDDGWYYILDSLLTQLNHHQKYTISQREDYDEEINMISIQQIKSKFGGLRFYYFGGDDFTRGLVSFAEMISMHTCESCGSPAKQVGENWTYTLCLECDRRRLRRMDILNESE